jgi:hypothetical protein
MKPRQIRRLPKTINVFGIASLQLKIKLKSMKKKVSIVCIVAAIALSGCSVFKKDCHCPKVYYKSYPSQRR